MAGLHVLGVILQVRFAAIVARLYKHALSRLTLPQPAQRPTE